MTMDRLFTAFVSSTFLDLQEERERLVKVLLNQRCVPFGMEFFPSTGRTQWPIIEEAMAAADFCIFVVAGRYGTMSDSGESWTHREFRAALSLGKPVVGILHREPDSLPADKVEKTPQGRDLLAAFRREIENYTVCRYYRDHADIVEAVASSITALRDENRIHGWVPAGQRPVVLQDLEGRSVALQESDFDRVYELVEAHWRYSVSKAIPGTWDGKYVGRRVVIGQDPDGLPACAIDFARDTDRQLPFARDRHPRLTLTESSRDYGLIQLAEPRKRTGSNFVQDVVFNPPLAVGERADFALSGEFPSYKYGNRTAQLMATQDSRTGPRTFDWMSRNVAYPTRHLEMSVFLPLTLGATPRGPLIGRTAVNIDRDLSSRISTNGSYKWSRTDIDGERGYLLSMRVDRPLLRRHYRLAWNLA